MVGALCSFPYDLCRRHTADAGHLVPAAPALRPGVAGAGDRADPGDGVQLHRAPCLHLSPQEACHCLTGFTTDPFSLEELHMKLLFSSLVPPALRMTQKSLGEARPCQ